jgi:hypothetical protein
MADGRAVPFESVPVGISVNVIGAWHPPVREMAVTNGRFQLVQPSQQEGAISPRPSYSVILSQLVWARPPSKL